MREHAQKAHREEGRESRVARLQQMRTHARAITASGNGFQNINETCPVYGDNSTKKKVANFHSKLANCTHFECSTCLESFPVLKAPHSNECTRCSRDKMKKFSCSNNMDPGPVPPELQGLTQVEEMLISAVMPMMSLYRLPLGQYGYSGHVVNLPQDISSFVARLPRLSSDVDVILVRKEGASATHKDFRVCRTKILCAL